jgi:hypothetical protein
LLAIRELARDRAPEAVGDRARVGGQEQRVARGSWIDARDPQALRRQDVADTREDALVHDDLLHRAPPVLQRLGEVADVNAISEEIRP